MTNQVLSQPADIDSASADAEAIERLFQIILGRAVNNDKFKNENAHQESIYYWVERLISSAEFKQRFLKINGLSAPTSIDFIPDATYRAPTLSLWQSPRLVLITGSCLMADWKEVIQEAHPATEIKYQVFNGGSELEDLSEHEISNVNFQVVQIALRSVIRDIDYFQTEFSALDDQKIKEHFNSSVSRLRRNLDSALKYNRSFGIPTFVLNFSRPQANPTGFLLPKYKLSNLSYYVQELNRELSDMIENEKSVYMVDYDEITSTLGKRFIQDDITSHINHGSLIGSSHGPHDIYLTPAGSIDDLYKPKGREAIEAVFNECCSHYQIISKNDKIKLVVFDLDGTLWRGVPADQDDVGPHLSEGWPLSILDAAAFLKKRGILLAIASKNDPDIAAQIWENLYGKIFPLSNFVSKKFSWASKVTSIEEILRETNILPANCLFVDDNPLERDQVKNAFPDIKIMDAPIYNWRRTLLWAPELQVPYITEESKSRTETIQGMIQRETIKETYSSEDDYLRELGITITAERISAINHKRFPRAFELLNKTNQFNTTGKRWDERELNAYFVDGGVMFGFDVSDKFNNYGITAVSLIHNGQCSQLVVSCRVFALRVEFSAIQNFLRSAENGYSMLFKDTGKNGLCRKFISRLGLILPADLIDDQIISISFPDHYNIPEEVLPIGSFNQI